MTAPQSAFDPRWLAGLDTLAEQATGLSEPNPRVACRIIAPVIEEWIAAHRV